MSTNKTLLLEGYDEEVECEKCVKPEVAYRSDGEPYLKIKNVNGTTISIPATTSNCDELGIPMPSRQTQLNRKFTPKIAIDQLTQNMANHSGSNRDLQPASVSTKKL